MALTAGTKLGPYDIRSPAGGRAEWAKCIARVTLLEREAAIKILLANMSLRCQSAPAFGTRSQGVSRPSHPHICALYVGSQDGMDFLVMELVEGDKTMSSSKTRRVFEEEDRRMCFTSSCQWSRTRKDGSPLDCRSMASENVA